MIEKHHHNIVLYRGVVVGCVGLEKVLTEEILANDGVCACVKESNCLWGEGGYFWFCVCVCVSVCPKDG